MQNKKTYRHLFKSEPLTLNEQNRLQPDLLSPFASEFASPSPDVSKLGRNDTLRRRSWKRSAQ